MITRLFAARTAWRLLLALLGTHVVHALAEAVTRWFSCWMPQHWCSVMAEDNTGLEDITGLSVTKWMFRTFMRELLVDFDYDTWFMLVVVLTGAAVLLLRNSLRQLQYWPRVLMLAILGAIIGTEFWTAEWGQSTSFRPDTVQLEWLLTNIATFAAAALFTDWAVGEGASPRQAELASEQEGHPGDRRVIVGRGRPIVVGGILLATAIALTLQFLASERHREKVGSRPPVLTLRFMDQTLDGWHGDHMWDGGPISDAFNSYVLGPAMRVPAGARLTAATASIVGAPQDARASFVKSSLPFACEDEFAAQLDARLRCLDWDTESPDWFRRVPVQIDATGTLSLVAPTEPGGYRLTIDADWKGLGGGEQRFAVEVKP